MDIISPEVFFINIINNFNTYTNIAHPKALCFQSYKSKQLYKKLYLRMPDIHNIPVFSRQSWIDKIEIEMPPDNLSWAAYPFSVIKNTENSYCGLFYDNKLRHVRIYSEYSDALNDNTMIESAFMNTGII